MKKQGSPWLWRSFTSGRASVMVRTRSKAERFTARSLAPALLARSAQPCCPSTRNASRACRLTRCLTGTPWRPRGIQRSRRQSGQPTGAPIAWLEREQARPVVVGTALTALRTARRASLFDSRPWDSALVTPRRDVRPTRAAVIALVEPAMFGLIAVASWVARPGLAVEMHAPYFDP